MSTVGYWTGATLAFAAELGSLAALAFWGFTLPAGTGVRVLAGVGVPLVAIALWWLFAAPRAAYSVPVLAVVTKVLVQGGAVLALVVAGHPRPAVVLGAAVVLGQLLTALPHQEARSPVS
jgi:Protein of unknown function (DUF2568)